MDFSFSDLNYNSVVIDNVAMLPSIETLPGFEARAAFLCSGKALRGNPVNSVTVFREDVDIVPTIIDDTLSYVPWVGELKVQRRSLLRFGAAILRHRSLCIGQECRRVLHSRKRPRCLLSRHLSGVSSHTVALALTVKHLCDSL